MPAYIGYVRVEEHEVKVDDLGRQRIGRDTIKLYEDKKYKGGRKRTLRLSEYATGMLHSLHDIDFKDCLSSIKWNLSTGIIATFYADHDGGGTKFTIHGGGKDSDLHNDDFGDKASSWRWYRL